MKPHEVYLRFFSQLLLTVGMVVVLQSTLRKAANLEDVEASEDVEGVLILDKTRECNI